MARKAVATNVYRQVGTYERLRKRLLNLADDGRLDKSLSYWVLPTDRRLPIAFLDRNLRELLDKPFDELLRTPGVGKKKIEGFFELLRRAAKDEADEPPFGLESPGTGDQQHAGPCGFDPTLVSESLWSTWCDTVRQHEFTEHKLGRVAPTLQSLPTVIWHTPLGEYADRSLSQIRRLRTHGEKRVHAILEVFCTVHEAVSTSVQSENLELDLLPRFIPSLGRWLADTLVDTSPPTVASLRRRVTAPLVQQIEVDLGSEVAQLAVERVESNGDGPTVKQQADRLGVTRARVYQLLDDCAKAMEVRWPEGRWLLAPLAAKCTSDASHRLIHTTLELFYPQLEGHPAMDYSLGE